MTPYVRSNVIYCRYAVVVWRLLVMRSHIGQTNERVGSWITLEKALFSFDALCCDEKVLHWVDVFGSVFR